VSTEFGELFAQQFGHPPFEGVPDTQATSRRPWVGLRSDDLDAADARRTAYVIHAIRRGTQRYHTTFTPGELSRMVALIHGGHSFCERHRKYSSRAVEKIQWEGKTMRLVYDRVDNAVVTFLPLISFRQEPAPDAEPVALAGDNDPLSPWYQVAPVIEQGGEKCYDSSTDETLQLKKGEAMDKPEITFKLAQRAKVFLRMAISGPSGSGKTYTSLMYGRAVAGMGGKIALVDTENERASYYAEVDAFRGNSGETFYNIIIEPPYTVAKYLAAIEAAEKAKFDVLILDSITHEWQGSGGVLETKNELDLRPGTNQWTNWARPTKEHNRFLAAMVSAKIHLICTMRSKEKYELVKNEKGQAVPVKLGMGPEQRPGTGYEFAVWLDMAMDHSAKVEKDITQIYAAKPDGIFKPTAEEAANLGAWLQQGIPLEQIERSVVSPAPGATQLTSVLPGWGDEKAEQTAQTQRAAAAKGIPASGEKLREVLFACRAAGKMLNEELRVREWSGILTAEHADAIIAAVKVKS